MKCARCQKEIAGGGKFCPECGAALGDDSGSLGHQPTVTAEADPATIGAQPTVRSASTLRRWKMGEKVLERYRIEGELGQGGMGVVYKCFDEVGGIEVALKALPPELSHNTVEMEEVRENFQLVARLVHQHIAAVRTLERDERTGDYYLILELAEGVDLRRWRKQHGGQVPLPEVLPILRQVAAALDYAHSRRVIHRDIKPANVMVGPDGAVKVLDFGLAAQIQTSLLRVSQVKYGTSGTGPYMPPEQWQGQRQDGASDQYALAVVAYELLAGRLPFESADATVLRQAVLNSAPEPPKDVPPAVWSVLERGLAKERQQRFGSCAEFVAALGAAAGRQRAAGGSGVALGSALRSRFWLGLAGGGGVVLLLLSLAGLNFIPHCRRPPPNPVPSPPLTNTVQPPPLTNTVQPPPLTNTVQPPPLTNTVQPLPLTNTVQPLPLTNTVQPPIIEPPKPLPFADLTPVTNELGGSLDYLATGAEKARQKQVENAKKALLPVAVICTKSRIHMRFVPAGSFEMGSPSTELGHNNNEALHKVNLTAPLYVGTYEITVGQWKRVMGDELGRASASIEMEDVAKCDVTWVDATNFCSRLSQLENVPDGVYRLLTEAEWEYSCRAGTQSSLASGDIQVLAGRSPKLDIVGWYEHNSRNKINPIGQLKPNAWGLYDMHGNVMEWCQDSVELLSDGTLYTSQTSHPVSDDPVSERGSRRIARGGCWFMSAEHCRAAKRTCYPPHESNPFLGFRVCRIIRANELEKHKNLGLGR